MKKKLAGVIAMMMVLLVGTTVFATPSVDKDSANEEILKAEVGTISSATAVTPDGNGVAVGITAVSSVDIVESAKTSAAVAAAKVAEGATANVLGIVDVQSGIPEGYISIDVTFQVSGIKMGDKVIVLHQNENGVWEILASKVKKDGEVTATFTSFSPVAIVRVEEAEKSDVTTDANGQGTSNTGTTDTNGTNADGTGTGSQGTTSDTEVKSTENTKSTTSTGLLSPITGDLLIPAVVVVVLVCGAGIILLGRKVITR